SSDDINGRRARDPARAELERARALVRTLANSAEWRTARRRREPCRARRTRRIDGLDGTDWSVWRRQTTSKRGRCVGGLFGPGSARNGIATGGIHVVSACRLAAAFSPATCDGGGGYADHPKPPRPSADRIQAS